uniref:Uncharacterized protein n=1 Tax=Arundo donax TaxID=35708 RepID=A0A0A9A0P2_ARUDO
MRFCVITVRRFGVNLRFKSVVMMRNAVLAFVVVVVTRAAPLGSG